MDYEREEFVAKVLDVFEPNSVVDNEGEHFPERPPGERLTTVFGLDTSYWRPFEYGSSSELMRRCTENDPEIGAIIQSQQVPHELMEGALRLFADSIIAYHGKRERKSTYRFYPAVLMAAWAAFEAFVRIYSELLVKTVPAVPRAVQLVLLEKEERVLKGTIQAQRRMQPSLERYWLLLKFGFGLEYSRGERIWQMAEEAMRKRHALVHYEVRDLPSVTATELCDHLEAIILLFIGPSARIGKSIMPGQFELFGVIDDLRPLVEKFEEKPFHKGWDVRPTGIIFPCAFENVDEERYPNFHQPYKRPGSL